MITVEKLTVQAGDFRLEDVSFQAPAGSYCALMGKTGSGKTTLLEAVCGLKHVASGRILLGELDVTNLKPAERNIGFVPQDGALFSTMKVRDQLAFALTVRKSPKSLIAQRVQEMSDLLEIGHLLHRTPQGLSGGEKQRVALGRALAFHPSTLCLDEPLSALDDDTRKQMYALLQQVRQRTGVTTLHVTHNRDEAERLADQVLYLNDGHLERRPISDTSNSKPNSTPTEKETV